MSRLHNASSPPSTQYDPPSSSSSSHFSRPGHPLRVNTDTLVPLNSRLRSNSTQSNSMSPPVYPSHQFSRSFSHNQVLPIVRDDVALAVSGLRGVTSSGVDGGYADDSAVYAESPDDVDPELLEEQTVRRIREALEKSPDRGDTLDLSRRGIERIGPQAVDVFRKGVGKDQKGVWRLALSYNSLSDDSITWSFSKLSRLRYLNLKGNNFTEFPEALSEMMALEILDLSKNKISHFPDTPGRLTQLKVLSLTSNRIRQLPSYLTEFNHLKVFKVDLNPIEWPPREVLGSLVDNEPLKAPQPSTTPNGRTKKDEDLRPWIENMKKWMRAKRMENEGGVSPDVARREDDDYLASEEEPSSAISADGLTGSMIHFGSISSPSLATLSSQQTIRPVRDASSDRLNESPDMSHHHRRNAAPNPHQSPESISSPPAPIQDMHSRDNSITSLIIPPLSASSASSSAHSRTPSANLPPPPLASPPVSGHSRGASYTATQRLSGTLRAKKSLPDLRKSHARIMEERRNDGKEGESSRPLGMGIEQSRSNVSSPKAWDVSSPPLPSRPSRSLARKGSADMLSRLKSPLASEIESGQDDNADVTATDESRNSYFRRLSTLPASSVSKTIPKALLRFIDATRGILYALSQVHVSLRQFLMYAVDDKVSNVFTRVMNPASKHLDQLINALDRFDSTSRRNKLPVQAVKDVIIATKACMVVTGKAVAVLKLQLPALKIGDIRYTRTLLLMIYGSMTEIACSWKDMTPLLAQIRQVTGSTDEPAPPKAIGSHKMAPSLSGHGRAVSPIAESVESSSPVAAVPVLSPPNRSTTEQRSQAVHVPGKRSLEIARQRDRRLAGSFSHEDVERGMLMPSPGGPRNDASLRNFRMPGHSRPNNSSTSALEDQTEVSEEELEEEILASVHPSGRSNQQDTSGDASSSVPLTPPDGYELNGNHPRIQGQRGHKLSSSSDSTSSGPNVPRKPSVDVRPPTPASAALFDDDLLDLLDNATDSAFTVWLKLAEGIGASSPSVNQRTHGRMDSQDSTSSSLHRRHPSSISTLQYEELASLLPQSEQVTSMLKESLMAVRADPANWATTSLPDQAQAFIRSVVSVAELVKSISTTHTFPLDVRQSLSKLTQTTRECAILIQVSSVNSRDLSGPHRPAAGRPPLSARSISPFRTKDYPRYGASNEDLTIHSATFNSNWAGPPSAGLRGLQLPSRQAAMSRSRSANNQGSGDSLKAPRMMGSVSTGMR